MHGVIRGDAGSLEGGIEHRAVRLHGPHVRGGKSEREVAIEAEPQEIGIAVRERDQDVARLEGLQQVERAIEVRHAMTGVEKHVEGFFRVGAGVVFAAAALSGGTKQHLLPQACNVVGDFRRVRDHLFAQCLGCVKIESLGEIGDAPVERVAHLGLRPADGVIRFP